MYKLLQLLIFGHIHKWKVINEYDFKLTGNATRNGNGTRYVLQCEHCGKLKNVEIV